MNTCSKPFKPFISYQAEHVRIVTHFNRNGKFYGVTHHLEVFRGENGMGDVIWVESEKLLPGWSEEILLFAIECTAEYQQQLKQFYQQHPMAEERPLLTTFFGISDHYG